MYRYRAPVLILVPPAIAILVALAWAGPPANASVTLAGAPIAVDVDLPSDSTGVPGGTLALRIQAPPSAADARYPDGAPVVVYAVGGTSAGSLQTQQLSLADDVVQVYFLFPGGTDLGRSSDGTYDYRGPNSIAALRDVVLYAAGELTDSRGRTIDEVVPAPVLHDNIGLVGASNGGNIVIAVAAQHGADPSTALRQAQDDSSGRGLAGHLQYILQWESPVSNQIATAELGPVTLDCQSSGPEHLFTENPRYLSYGSPEVDVDYSQLTYDPGSTRHPLFWDGNGDGRYTTVVDPNTDCRTPDLDLSGTLELDEDYPLRTDGAHQSYSRPATQAMSDLSLFGSSWPANIPTPAEADAFWSLREAVSLYANALTNIPQLEGMVLVSVVDHYQPPSDKPHIRQAFEGWDEAGHWVKLNPARDYVLEVDASLSGRPALPDNVANTAPADWTDAGSYAYPDDLDFVYFAAAIHEMADRAHAAGAQPIATSTQTTTPTASPTATPTPTVTRTPTPTPTPTPAVPQCVADVNGNGVVDVEDIMTTASDLPCHVYLPVVAANWRQPWPAPPGQPPDGPGGSDYAHTSYTVVERGLGDRKYWVYQPAEPQPAQAPVVVFLHGWGALSPNPYLFWLEHLVQKGNIVIYPKYQASWLTPTDTFTENAIDAVKDALNWLERDPGRVKPDRTKFAILGHSYGGAITVNMAHRWQSAGLPQPRAIMPVQPGTEDGGIDNIDSLSDIPSSVLMNCHVGSDDEVAGREVCDIIWDRTGHIPAANRDYVVMYSDDYGEPDLDADHHAPTGSPNGREVDALDWYGFWKDFDALRDCAFYGTNCAYGVGDTPEHRFMGFWSDGTPVRELQITDVKP